MAQSETKVLTAHIPLSLAEKVDQEDERKRLTREAMADVQAGRVIAHQVVKAWADNLGTDNPLPTPAVGVR